MLIATTRDPGVIHILRSHFRAAVLLSNEGSLLVRVCHLFGLSCDSEEGWCTHSQTRVLADNLFAIASSLRSTAPATTASSKFATMC